jgi:hypothetical protein
MEELMSLEGEGIDLELLARSFPTGPIRVEKRKDYHLLILENDSQRDATDVLADGANALAQMTAIMLAEGSNFRPPRIVVSRT